MANNEKTNPGNIWMMIAAVYFVAGVSIDIYIGVSGDHSLSSVNTHINLLSWASFFLIGLIYFQFPKITNTPLTRIQF